MTVSRYLFQSPYSSAVQVGRPDTSVKQEEKSDTTSTQAGTEDAVVVNTTLQEAQSLEATQVSEVKPTVESSQLLDIYA